MKNIKSTAALLMALVFVVVNIIFFLWVDPSKCGSAEWIAYGFMCFSFLCALVAMLTYSGKSDEVYSLTVVYLPLRYFYVQTILSALGVVGALVIRGMTITPENASFFIHHYDTILLTVYIIVLLIYAVRFILHRGANQATESSLRQQHIEHSYVRDLTPTLSNLMPMISDPAAKKAVNNLYEAIRYSANKTSEQGQANRVEVANGIDTLTNLVMAKDWQGTIDLANRLTFKAKMK